MQTADLRRPARWTTSGLVRPAGRSVASSMRRDGIAYSSCCSPYKRLNFSRNQRRLSLRPYSLPATTGTNRRQQGGRRENITRTTTKNSTVRLIRPPLLVPRHPRYPASLSWQHGALPQLIPLNPRNRTLTRRTRSNRADRSPRETGKRQHHHGANSNTLSEIVANCANISDACSKRKIPRPRTHSIIADRANVSGVR